ncbi:hypothetical protein BJV77DRAFT_592315 [Russula vinacea]|nr:hypothetical protein BJV77DRAFT_592315 [Russula vinacea]
MSASVPPLGLSNKAASDILPVSTSASRRPFEAELASITLWPEVEKVLATVTSHCHSRLLVPQAVRNSM